MSGPTDALRWRVLVHALDRTGPPMLARSVLRWLHAVHPEIALEVVAFRGGPLERDLAELAEVLVVLDDEEAWDTEALTGARGEELRRRLADTGPAVVNLLVSVAAGQALPLLPEAIGPVVTWSVEVGEDLHWVDGSVGLRERTVTWLAGSDATAAELAERLGGSPPRVAPELIDAPGPVPDDVRAELRASVAVGPDDVLVLGAGIGTHRKGIDLFVETAVAHRRLDGRPARFVWVGGVRDELHRWVRADLRRLDLDHVELLPPVADLDPWCAAADLFLHTARLDAFPLVCLHAAATATPVVAFLDRSGTAEMFGPDQVGAPYPDVGGLARQVARLAGTGAGAEVGRRQQARIARRHLAPDAVDRLHRTVVAALGEVS